MEKVDRDEIRAEWRELMISGEDSQKAYMAELHFSELLADSERCERLEGALGVIFNLVGAIENYLAEEHNDPFMRALCLKMMSIIEALGVPPANRETRESLEAYLAALEVPDGE